MKKLSLVIITIMVIPSLVLCQDDFQRQRVAVFKNGTGFFMKSGNVEAKDGRHVLASTPDALFGTIWITSKDNSITGFHTLKTKVTEPQTAESIKGILLANIDKKAKVSLYNDISHDADIISISGEIVTLATKEKWISTEISTIKTIEFYEKPEMSYAKETNQNKLAIDFVSDGSKTVSLMYLERGIGWFPSYLIEINDEGQAMVTLRSLLVNDAEEIDKANIKLVVGVPNFKYSNLFSPLCSQQTIQEFITSLNNMDRYSGRYDAAILSNKIMTQSATSYDMGWDDQVGEVLPDGSNIEDLFFYDLKKVSLKKGERSTFELLKHEVPYKHIYEIDLQQNQISGYNVGTTNRVENKVWHSIKLNNISGQPWTTGTASVMKRGENVYEPLSQDILKYTPNNGSVNVKITVAPDISVKDTEEEVDRAERHKKQNSYYYDLATIKGEIKIKNYKKEAITIKVKRKITGKLLKSDITWTSTRMPSTYYKSIDPINDVEWELDLKAGEEKKINYTYTIYIAR